MKKILLLITLIVAQISLGQDLRIGPKVGMGVSNISGDVYTEPQLHIILGGVFNYQYTQEIGIGGELLFSTQGAKNDANNWERDQESYWSYTYLRVPIYVYMEPLENLLIDIGPQFAVPITASYKRNKPYEWVDDEYDIKKEIDPIDILLGIGAQYKVNENLQAGIRFTYGLNDFDDRPNDRSEFRHVLFNFNASYMINK